MEAAPIRMDRKTSIETEPRTLRIDQIEFAREAAKYVVNTKNIEEAMSIFTEGLKPVVSSIKQNGDEMMIDSVEEPEHSDDYFIRPRGPQDDSIANGRWKAFPILSKCRQVGNSFNDCRWSWIPRTTNMAPDRLASQRYVKMCDFLWVDRTHLHLFMYLIKMDYLAHISFIRKCKG